MAVKGLKKHKNGTKTAVIIIKALKRKVAQRNYRTQPARAEEAMPRPGNQSPKAVN